MYKLFLLINYKRQALNNLIFKSWELHTHEHTNIHTFMSFGIIYIYGLGLGFCGVQQKRQVFLFLCRHEQALWVCESSVWCNSIILSNPLVRVTMALWMLFKRVLRDRVTCGYTWVSRQGAQLTICVQISFIPTSFLFEHKEACSHLLCTLCWRQAEDLFCKC